MAKDAGTDSPPGTPPTADQAKAIEAIRRAVPTTRMLDYGVIGPDIQALLSATGPDLWGDLCEGLANDHVRQAAAHMYRGEPNLGAQEYEWAAAALNVGQLAFNGDTQRKIALYLNAVELLKTAAASGTADFVHLDIAGDFPLAGWAFSVSDPIGCALIVGGLSGWSISYFGLARALARRGVASFILDGPGQGEVRMRTSRMLSRDSIGDFGPAIARAKSIGPVAVIGNSFGGLTAAHIAARWREVRACCINGAAPTVTVPDFRMAREQMAAAFGSEGEALAANVAAFCFEPARTPIGCPTLILEGGADPLVAPGVQFGFWPGGNIPAGSMVRRWADGEHTLYNHANERNAFVAAWIGDRLNTPGAQYP